MPSVFRSILPGLVLATAACGPTIDVVEDGDGTSTGPDGTSTGTGDTAVDPDSTGIPPIIDDFGGDGCPDAPGCTKLVDLLVVVDNSRTMARAQLQLAQTAPILVEGLREVGGTLVSEADPIDAHVMVTTTDVGNPLCTPLQPPGYQPAVGRPVSTACTDRLEDFVDVTGTLDASETCLEACPVPVAPEGAFLAFGPEGSNVVGGEGFADPESVALGCMIPQGINGCDYESPLDAMLRALDPDADWNSGPEGFSRARADLVIVILTDEYDCSILDHSIMEDPALHNVDPATGMTAPTSALCWNAGVTCEGPDANGIYPTCDSRDAEYLHPTERYAGFLADLDRDVAMLGILGVPEVFMHDPTPPFEPLAGGAFDLTYRRWIDFPFPAGDIPPDEWAEGVTAADKEFERGIGPGCSAFDDRGTIVGQASPPVRVLEVCESLNLEDESAPPRCAVESVCDQDFESAARYVAGLFPTG